MTETNPLLNDWTAPFGLPPFESIETSHFRPAFEAAMADWRADVERIATNPAPASFENTIVALERSGESLDRVAGVFFNKCSSDTSPELQEIEAEISAQLAKQHSEIYTDARLFARVDGLTGTKASLELDPQAERVLDLYHEAFMRAGARLDEAGRARMSEISQRLASLGANFGKNVLADEKDIEIIIEDEAGLAGLPKGVIAAMAQAAEERGHAGKWLVTTLRSSAESFLQYSTRRDLREAVWRGFVARGAWRDETATSGIVSETLRLRVERARLLGFDDFASFKLDNQMAKRSENVRDLLTRVWSRARVKSLEEAEALQGLMASEGENAKLAPWDWLHYSEKLRQRELDLEDAEVKPYLVLENIVEAAFDTASRLFGLAFKELSDVPRPHPEARVWDVTKDGAHVGLFVGDYFARPSKRSGAWMSGYRDQHKLNGEIRPIIMNTMNFSKPPAGEPALLTLDDARTLFHEFGHALHGLMSNVTYPRISGTSVARDFVELPSQLYEHWLTREEVLSRFARHAETGEAMPAELLAKLRKAETFNKGCETVEYLSSAIVDLEYHCLGEVAEDFDPLAVEADILAGLEMPAQIAMRHRTPHFQHVFSGDGYSSGYYSYMWSEVMDADAFGAFEEAGDVFDSAVAGRLAEHVYSAGGSAAPEALYQAFRGRDPEPDALLKRRGLLDDAA